MPETDPAERGRYSLYPHPSGKGVLISRSVGLCGTCSSCKCGEQQELIDLSPGGVTGMIKKMGGLGKMRGVLSI
jgi:hypothetical protein